MKPAETNSLDRRDAPAEATGAAALVQSYAEKNAELVAAFERWLLIVKNYSRSTCARYAATARAFATFLESDSAMTAGPRQIRAFLSIHAVASAPAFNHGRRALRSLYKFLTLADVVQNSPAHLVPPWKYPPRRLPRVLTEREVDSLIACTASLRERALIELLYASGLRIGEAADLRIGDLDLDAGTLRVRHGKGNKERLGLIGSKAVEALRAHLGVRRYGSVFLGSRGRPLGKESLSKIVKATAARAGFSDVRAHTLRHTFATVMLNDGVDIRYVQELLGHKRISTTQIYTHLATADLVRTYNRCHPHAKGETDAEG